MCIIYFCTCVSFSQLLCKFEPDSVLTFLKSFEDYRLEHCLKLCQEHGITDAAAYLFERVGDVGSALSLALNSVDLHIHEMDLSVARLFVQNMNVDLLEIDKIEQYLTIPEVSTCSKIALYPLIIDCIYHVSWCLRASGWGNIFHHERCN